MKYQNNIPATKVERATKFVQTGIKVGGNYIKHYAKKAFDSTVTREDLHEENAADIYSALSELKGSALKVAQMMSMDRNLLPRAYTERFAMAQYSAPPLSGPLVVKTFTNYFGKTPQQMFDTFGMNAVNAASIGQVHQATKDGKKLAVKIQYPGVADSVRADLKMVKPFAVRLMNLNERDGRPAPRRVFKDQPHAAGTRQDWAGAVGLLRLPGAHAAHSARRSAPGQLPHAARWFAGHH
jgi:predicted unusual protein kinase regulating ubiquinone biosynthesis (AarF/ABC1/UbiB family)